MTVPLRSGDPITVNVALGDRAYDIAIGRGLLATLGERMQQASAGMQGRDRHRRHGGSSSSRGGGGFAYRRRYRCLHPVKVPAGESSKSFRHFERVCNSLIAAKIERDDIVVALGGGVVGDLAGFAASVLRRGVDYVQVPTTLLAQVDSSVGGKTGVNTPRERTWSARSISRAWCGRHRAARHLPEREFLAGYAEVVKYGLLGDAGILRWLEANWRGLLAGDAVARTRHAVRCRAKAAIVARDERETGDRRCSTSAIPSAMRFEAATGFSDGLLHGEAVGLGWRWPSSSARLGLCPRRTPTASSRILRQPGCPPHVEAVAGGNWPGTDAMMDLISQDKKVKRGQLTFILVRGIGEAFVTRDVDADQVRAFIAEKLASR